MKTWILGTVLCALGAPYALGQATARIHGVVQDQSDAVVPNATVKATHTETGISRTVATEADGSYVFANLPLGPYRLEVQKEGFANAVQAGIVLQVDSDPAVPITLRPGATNETITVEATTSQVETRSVGVGTTVMESARILELPLNGRQATDLISLSGLSVVTSAQPPTYTMATGPSISVAGGMSWSVQYNLDGAPHLDTYVGTSMPLPFPDALQEFKLVTSSQEASNGGHSGAVVDAVTKSGSNAFHGDLFEFFRNADLNPRDAFAAGSDGLKRNQFGGVLGGPIKKDKLFFFLGYEGTTIRQNLVNGSAFVPTAKELQGDFSQYIAANCPGAQAVARSPAVLSHFSGPFRLNPAAVKISALLPQTSDPCGHVLFGTPVHQNQLQAPVRIDYQVSPKQSVFARYMITRIETTIPYDLSHNILSTPGIGQDDTAQALALADTYLINTSTVNSFRISGTRVGAATLGAKSFTPQDVGMNYYSYYGFVPIFMPGIGFSTYFPANFSVGYDTITNFGANDDLSLIRGSHQFSFGGNFSRTLLNASSYAWSENFFLFAGIFGTPLIDFLTGNVTATHEANPNPDNVTQNFFGLYASDTWKATRRLTVTYGVRWNPYLPIAFKQSDTYNFSLSNFYNNVHSKVYPAAPPGLLYVGDAGVNDHSGMNNQWGHVEPRVGIAWDPTGSGKTAIRAGAGIAYDFIRLDIHENTSSVAPFRITVTQQFAGPGSIPLDNPFATYPGGNPFPYNFDKQSSAFPQTPYQGFLPIDPDLKAATQYSWNFGIQRQITKRLFASATYVGTEIAHLWTGVDLNPPQWLPGKPIIAQPSTAADFGQCAALQANCGGNAENFRRLLELRNPSAGNIYGSITGLDASGTQNYNGLLLNSRWQVGQNVNLGANWTWSHCIGLPATNLANLEAVYPHQPYQNNGPQDRHLDYGDCTGNSIDIRHIVNVTMVANTPQFSGTWLRRLASGWSTSTIYTWRTGAPITTILGTDNALNGFNPLGANPVPQRAQQVLPDVYATDKGQSCVFAPCVSYLNPQAVAFPALGTYGDMGVSDLRAPGFWEWDQAIIRQFPINERMRLEFRAEAYNVTNSVRLGAPSTTLGTSFGQITSDQPTTGNALAVAGGGSGARVIQFALKFVF
jgi:Carboxypeptidase regulatory-like domain